MGILISRFRKKKTTYEILEELDKKIKEIEQYGQNTEQRHKRIVGTLILYSVALYMITAVIFYFYFFPAALYDQLFYITPLLLFPFLIIFTKKMVTLYYKRKISRNQSKLSTMQEQKKEILEVVTDTETYKKAKEILLKFAPDQLRMTPMSPQVRQPMPSTSTSMTPMAESQRFTTPIMSNANDPSLLRRRALASVQSTNFNRIMPESRTIASSSNLSAKSTPLSSINPGFKPYATPLPAMKSPLPRPILFQQKSYMDRLIDFLVGDGPSNRYALICRECYSHNGMSLKEEFEYYAFRCCYCGVFNSARKQKPSAPKLESEGPISEKTPPQPQKKTDIETVSTSSGSDSDIEVVEKPGENERILTEEEEKKEVGKESEKNSSSDVPPQKIESEESPTKE